MSGRAYVCLKGAITVAHYLPAVGLSAAPYLGRQHVCTSNDIVYIIYSIHTNILDMSTTQNADYVVWGSIWIRERSVRRPLSKLTQEIRFTRVDCKQFKFFLSVF